MKKLIYEQGLDVGGNLINLSKPNQQQKQQQKQGQGTIPRPPGTEKQGQGTIPRPPGTEKQGQGTIPRPPDTEKQGQGTIPRPPGTEKQGQGTSVNNGTQKLEYLECVNIFKEYKSKNGIISRIYNNPKFGKFDFYSKNKNGKYIVLTKIEDGINFKKYEYKCNNGFIVILLNNGNVVSISKENLSIYESVKDGKINGFSKVYDKYGELTIKGNYVNNVKNGVWEWYWSNGNIVEKGIYVNDKREGYWFKDNDNTGYYEKILYKNNEVIGKPTNFSKNDNDDAVEKIDIETLNKNSSNQDTSNKNQLKYYKCNDFPFTYGCVNSKISEIQTILNVTPNKGYFGPKTLKALNSKLDKKDIEELRKNGITQNIFNKIVSTVPKQSTTTEPKQSTTTEPKQSTTEPVSTTTEPVSTTTEPVLKDVVTKQEKPEGYNGLNDKLKNRYDERQSKIDQLNNIDNLTRKQKRILNRLNTKQKALLDKGKENLEKNLQESIKKEIDLINEMFIKINKNYFR